jgi:hypothetical protein
MPVRFFTGAISIILALAGRTRAVSILAVHYIAQQVLGLIYQLLG